MKTPNEIKKGLEYCTGVGDNCDICPYQGCNVAGRSPACDTEMEADALAYIQQLEEELAERKDRESGLSIMLTSAQSAAETYKRELDAAIADINMCCPCEVCTRSCTYDKVNPYDECADFEWRGLPELPKEEV